MGKTKITTDSVVIRNQEKIMASPVGDEIVMMSMESGNYIGLNKVGTEIWGKLEQPIAVKDLIAYLLAIYDIDEAECELKTIKYLNEMLSADLIIIKA